MQFNDTHSRVSVEEVEKYAEKLAPYITHVNEIAQDGYDHPESFLNLPVDKETLSLIGDAVRDKKTPGLKYIVVIGMGGSVLGTKAIYDALFGYVDALTPERYPKCVFLDTTDAGFLSALTSFLITHVTHPEEVVINVVTKSGETTETVANTNIILGTLEEKWGSIADRLVITTDFGSPLWKKAKEQEIARLSIPEKISGRYSVFSAVGLFPLAMCEVNINALLTGATQARKQDLLTDIAGNNAARSAIQMFAQYGNQKRIHNTFIFSEALTSFGGWYRQLMAESIGKKGISFTPIVSVGPRDLHSVGQMYFDGGNDMVTTFLQAMPLQDPGRNISTSWTEGLPFLAGKLPQDITKAIEDGVKRVYAEKELPFMDITMNAIDETELGALMQFKMDETMYLAHLFEVNAFDQPAVESYKENTRNILSENK